MKKEQLEELKNNIKIAEEAAKQLEGQMSNLEEMLNGAYESLEGEDKQKILELKALSNRAILKAKQGGDYMAEIEKIKKKFKS